MNCELYISRSHAQWALGLAQWHGSWAHGLSRLKAQLRRKGLEPMGRIVGLKFVAQVGLGTLVPHISPPLICARPTGTNQGH